MSVHSWQPPEGRRQQHREPPVGFAAVMALGFHGIGNMRDALAHDAPLSLLAAALLVIGPIALVLRRRAPLVVLAVAVAASIGYAVTAEPSWTFAVAPTIALFHAARLGRGRQALPVAAAGWGAYVLVTWTFAARLGVPAEARIGVREAVLTAAAVVLALMFGSGSRSRAAYQAEQAKVQAEQKRARQEQERRQASDERLRIARELHDVLGHHLSLINVQAGVGLHLMDSRPEQAREALSAIKTASSEALREVRSVLGALRPEEEAAPRQPALGLDRLEELTAGTGLTVTTTVTGPRRELPAEVDRAAYRIVQEALTNVRRHAGAAATTVTIDYRPGALGLAIRNERPAGGGDDEAGEGSGIAGMQARAETLGGKLTAGPVDDGGYLVEAVLPTDGEKS
ncbi:sensor histidine kinase [Actinoplanes sp. RD1]|uniref:sensor histidine kinase n=1 Tax=Actinoplanes sp. RD1 TaxID=3064538 RepID=UPI002740FC68|nr:histidine kinase [Actinoplanes sp. RD1]